MAVSWKRLSSLFKDGVGIATRIIVGLIIGPLLTVLYPLCWIRVKLTALIYCNHSTSLLASQDVISVIDIDRVDSIINVINLTRGNFTLDAMKELFLSKVLKATDVNNRPLFPKFTRYIKFCASYLMWTEESNFNIDDHIRPYNGQPPKDEEQLKTLINELCNKLLPSLKSGWEIIVIPLEYSQSDVPRTCILFRVHHFITDGISIVRLIIEQMAGNHGAFQPILKRMQNKFKPRFNNAFINMLVNVARIIYKYIFTHTILSPEHINHVFIKNKSEGFQLSKSAYIDWTSSVKMDTISSIRNATATSVNDVLMSCMAGAFRKYFVSHDICPPDFLTTVIPTSFHGPDDSVRMMNKVYGPVSQMPIAYKDCVQRLKATKVETDRLKCSPDNISYLCFQKYWLNIIPYTWTRELFEYVNINVNFSNIPGPTSKAAFNGNTIETLVVTDIPSRQLGFGVNIFTYSGDVVIAVSVDKARVNSREDVRQLLDDFVEEVQQLYNSVVGSPNKTPSTAMEKKID